MHDKYLAGDYADYFEYLYGLVGGARWVHGLEYNLLRMLERKYYWRNPIDGRLSLAVETLRANGMREAGINPMYIPNGQCSVLEVLIVLAKNVDYQLSYDPDSPDTSRVPSFFSDFMDVLGFKCPESEIDIAIDRFLDGETRISYETAADATLWSQINQFYLNRFSIESEEM